MKAYKFYITAAFSLIAGSTLAQSELAVMPESFEEYRSDESLISVPHWLRGLQFAAETALLRPKLQLIPPLGWGHQRICVNATTIDGQFVATGQYQLPALGSALSEGEMIELSYPTKFPDTWSASTATNAGIVLSEGQCQTPTTTGAGSRLVPAVFNGSSALKRDSEDRLVLVVAIHARNTQELRASLTYPGGEVPAACSKITAADAIQFNFVCELAVPKIVSGEAGLSVTRLNGGRQAPVLRARVVIPDPT